MPWGMLVGALLGFAALPASAEMVQFLAAPSARNQLPPNNSAGTGSATASLDTQTGVLTWEIRFEGLSGGVTAAHFHGPADSTKNAKIAIAVAKAGDVSPVKGSATLTPEQIADVTTGLWYLNIHTTTFPPGEIRGQVVRK